MIDLAIALVLQLGILCALARRLPRTAESDERPSTSRGVTRRPACGWDAARRMIERAYEPEDARIADPAAGEFDA